MGTALVMVDNFKGKRIVCRAMIDSGSQINLISTCFAKKLNLNFIQKPTEIYGVGNKKSVSSNRLNISIFNKEGSFNTRIEAIVLSQITSYQPSESLDINQYISDDVVLADAGFCQPNTIDMLLGADIFPKIIQEGVKSLGNGLPNLINTVNWVVMGSFKGDSSLEKSFCGVLTEELDFLENAPRLWDMEDSETFSRKPISLEEQRSETIFEETTIRGDDGKFIVQLPKSKFNLGESYRIALQRFSYLERRFAKDPILFRDYYDFLNEYLQLGHMKRTSWEEIPESHYFVPHHPVFKADSTTTKMRVVFDASCKTSQNLSLNNIILKGPVLQDDIFNLLVRFRFSRFAMSADIEKMYRQIWVADEDQYQQLILWRNSPSDNIAIYKLRTVTYGTTSAPYLAVKCLQKISENSNEEYPKASYILSKDFYVDDLITGFDS